MKTKQLKKLANEILKKYDSARRFAEPRGLEILVPQEDEILLI